MSVYPGNILTATAATVSASPTSTRTWQWFRSGTAIPAATASGYVVTTEDIDALLTAQQTETNFLGATSATSVGVGPVETYSPAMLFALNEPGVWFDPSDLTTLFKEAEGTNPVTAPGDTVGLMLDKSRGLVLGPELVVNGDFSGGTTTGWTLVGDVTVVDGRLRLFNSFGGRPVVQQSFPTVVGRSYKVTFSFEVISGGVVNCRIVREGGATDIIAPNTGTGVFTALDTTTIFYMRSNNTTVGSGLFIDNVSVRELPGNHAVQATFANRPLYGIVPFGGRRNLLVWSEDFSVPFVSNTGWSKVGVVASGSRITANAGTSTAFAETVALNAPASAVTISAVFAPTSGRNRYVWIGDRSVIPIASATFDLNSVSVVGKDASVTAAVVTLPDGSVKCSVTHTRASVGTSSPQFALAGATYTSDRPSLTWAGGEFLDAKVQFEIGSTATAYQRVTTQYDVTEAGVQSCSYLAFDGGGDFMQTGTITPGTDKAQVFAGVRKFSTSTNIIAETGPNSDATNGTFAIGAYGTEYLVQARGTTLGYYIPAGYFSPTTNVLTGLLDTAGATLPSEIIARVDGLVKQAAGTGGGSVGTGNFLAYPLYIGARTAGAFSFNGLVFSLITRFGPNLDATTINATEYWVGDKTGFPNWANIVSPTIFARDDTAVLDRFNQIIERRA